MQANLRSALIALPLALSLLFATGCSRNTKVDTATPEAIINGVNKGDTVRITTKSNVKHKFQVTKITNKALYGDTERVVYEDIDKLEVEGKKSGGIKEAWNRIF